jgi:hypothetical protein
VLPQKTVHAVWSKFRRENVGKCHENYDMPMPVASDYSYTVNAAPLRVPMQIEKGCIIIGVAEKVLLKKLSKKKITIN